MRIRLPQNLLAISHDCFMAAISFGLALYLRLSERMFSWSEGYLIEGTAAFTVLLLGFMLYFRTYRRLWRYTSLNDLLGIAKAGTLALVVFYIGMFFVTRLELLPRSVPFIHWMCLMVCLTAGRVTWRIFNDRWLQERFMGRGNPKVPVLLIGASPDAEMFIRESSRNPEFPYRVVGIVDDDKTKHGREIHHARIYGSIEEAPYILRKLTRKGRTPQRMVVSDVSIELSALEPLLQVAEANGMTVSRLPKLSELRSGDASAYEMRPVAVEDILGRTQAVLDFGAMEAMVKGKRVMVTGAGGSIGSELVRQIQSFAPSVIILYEQSEFNLYEMDRELSGLAPNLTRFAIVGDVRDATQLDRIMAHYKPEIVFHAAAVKHVPLSEANPDQAVLTNVLGSKQVADACVKYGVGAMVQISTDKAVNPTSVMGSTKRVAEMVGQLHAQEHAQTRFITVRFGNVLNSAGSVVPLFQEQIASGGPVTVTHPDMTRYFMTIKEAVQLVLQAAVLGLEVDDHAPIYVLDMGEPVKIVDLATQMIRLAGLRPNLDVAIEFTGLRPGEKLFEELFHDAENLQPTAHASIQQARARTIGAEAMHAAINALVDAARQGEDAAIRKQLHHILPEYIDTSSKHEKESA